MSYTGTAAFNINGQTIHSALNIRKTSKKYTALGEKAITDLRVKLEHIQCIIIDEISMVDKNMLNYVSGRLDQIKRCSSLNSLFGGISVLAVGDFCQVPPVFGQMLYKNCHENIVDYWGQFKVWELIEIMRQKEDKMFAEFLNRLRTKQKNEQLHASDVSILKSRVILDDDKYLDSAMHIYALNKSVNAFNEQKLNDSQMMLLR